MNDIKIEKFNNYKIDGMCMHLSDALEELYGIIATGFVIAVYLPEFEKLKPKNKDWDIYWWSTKNTNTTRIKKFKQLIKETE